MEGEREAKLKFAMERYSFNQVNGEIFVLWSKLRVFPLNLFGEGDNDPLAHLQVDASRRHEFRRHDLSLQQSHALDLILLDLKLCITLMDINI